MCQDRSANCFLSQGNGTCDFVGFRIRKQTGVLGLKRENRCRLRELQADLTDSLLWAVVGLELCREHSTWLCL